jgi:hypothetical protein
MLLVKTQPLFRGHIGIARPRVVTVQLAELLQGEGGASGSHPLGRVAAQISADWQRMYGHPIYCLETFVDPELLLAVLESGFTKQQNG